MMYNLGLQKIVVQMFIGQHNQMIYKIPKTDKFLSFVNYHNFDDLGFKTDGLYLDGCSKFAYLTLNELTQKIFVNIMMIDPYFVEPQILHWKSSAFFYEKRGSEFYDMQIKTVLYNTKTEVKMVKQYPTFLQEYSMMNNYDEVSAQKDTN